MPQMFLTTTPNPSLVGGAFLVNPIGLTFFCAFTGGVLSELLTGAVDLEEVALAADVFDNHPKPLLGRRGL